MRGLAQNAGEQIEEMRAHATETRRAHRQRRGTQRTHFVRTIEVDQSIVHAAIAAAMVHDHTRIRLLHGGQKIFALDHRGAYGLFDHEPAVTRLQPLVH